MKSHTTAAFLMTLALSVPMIHGAGSNPPNIVIVIADDMDIVDRWVESQPAGNDLEGGTVKYGTYDTPNLDEFRSESVIFPQTFCGGPKCAPSRFSIMTGRQPARCEYAQTNSEDGPNVASKQLKLTGNDAIFNIPNVLRNDAENPYYTGMVGKWHLMTGTDNGHKFGCEDLANTADAQLYEKCRAIMNEMGFDFADAWYYENINNNDAFTHNPEWMVSQAQRFIDEAVNERKQPFFLYFASTLTHGPDASEALRDFDYSGTPKGTLDRHDMPDDTAMMTRAEVVATSTGDVAGYWMDDMFGALMTYLKEIGVYDSTFVVFQNDHGQQAKGSLYQQGSRILNFVRYPPAFGKDGPNIMPSDFVTSNVDLAATVFDLVDISPPDGYLLDGLSYINDVAAQIASPSTAQQTSCLYKYVDILESHSIVSEKWQYIFRRTDKVEAGGGAQNYPHWDDQEQLYDLVADPNEKTNLISNHASDDEQTVIAMFQQKMRDYIDDICGAEECIKPELLFGTNAPYTTQPGGGAPDSPDSPDSPDTTEEPEPTEPIDGCCKGSSSRCSTDDEAQCLKFAVRAGCEWAVGSDCEIVDTTPVPGCCAGSNSKCQTDDAALCAKFAARAGCEWRTGDEADCSTEAPEPGCCFGANSKCVTDDEAKCNKFAARAGCEWLSGAEADCSVPEPEPGCCAAGDADSKQASKCYGDDVTEAQCDKLANRAGCEWRTGDDAECVLMSARVLSVDVRSDLVDMDTSYVLLIAAIGVAVLAMLKHALCASKKMGDGEFVERAQYGAV